MAHHLMAHHLSGCTIYWCTSLRFNCYAEFQQTGQDTSYGTDYQNVFLPPRRNVSVAPAGGWQFAPKPRNQRRFESQWKA